MSKNSRLRKTVWFLFLSVSVWLVAVAVYQTHKTLSEALNYRGEVYSVENEDLEFIYDLTYVSEDGSSVIEQNIFDEIFAAIESAQRYVLLDMFLFNSYAANSDVFYRDLSRELTDRLIEKKRESESIAIDLITDPINTVYGGSVSPEITRLRNAGINVIITDLHRLRDSNYIYSAFWRTFLQWFHIFSGEGRLRHPFSSQDKVTLAGYLDLLNFKANHRKVLVADAPEDFVTIITSANPHGGSSKHSNIGLVVKGDFWRSVYEAERGVAIMSGSRLAEVGSLKTSSRQADFRKPSTSKAVLLTENQIKQAVLNLCNEAGDSDSIRLAQFYLADRDIIAALLKSEANGVDVKIVLDPNRDAFGYEKNGIPNRQAAEELVEKSNNRIEVRWYDTHGEQFHTKLFVKNSEQAVTIVAGSANLTRRNLDNFNLEMSVYAELEPTSEQAERINAYFDRIWSNEDGSYTVDFEVYRENSSLKYIMYRIQEKFGLGTF